MSQVQELITKHIDIWTAAETEKRLGRGRASGNAGSVYGIKKLRELILELAVRGKLVPQDDNDEPASELLKRIHAEKDKLFLDTRSKTAKSKTPISLLDEPFNLPKGWNWVRLADIATVIRGVTYGKADAHDTQITDYVPLLRGNNINRILNFDGLVYVPKKLLKDEQFIRNGDIVIAMSSGSADLVGKAAQATSVFLGGFGAFCGVVRPISSEVIEFFGFFFQTPLYRNRAAGHGKGIGINNLQKTALDTLEIPLPPMSEQHRIVAKVDELMALCDQLEAQHNNAAEAHEQLVSHLLGTLTQSQDAADFNTNWQRIATHFDTLFTTESSIDTLKQTLLQLAVMGKLVPQDPNDEPASELLKHIQAEKAKLVEAYPYLSELPKIWRLKKLIDVSLEIVDCPHSTPKWTTEGMICVRTSQFRAGNLDLSNIQYVSEETYNDRIQRLKPKENDILYSREGGILGVACRIPSGIDLCLGQRMMLIRAGTEIRSDFLELLLNSPLITSIARKMTIGGAAPRVNVSTVKAYPIPLPSIEEQHGIVAKVDELMSLCEQLKSHITEAKQHQQKLADVLVENSL